ncbi:MAG: hypothetical protein ABMA64_08125 [Myxococcota bacterium]
MLLPSAVAYATPMSVCSVTAVDVNCRPTPTAPDPGALRFTVSCATHSAAPGGPVSVSAAGRENGPLCVARDGVDLSCEVRPTATCGMFKLDGTFVPGIGYEVRRPSGEVLGRLWTGPDHQALRRCTTNPDTCAEAADEVPSDLAPWLRLHACARGERCERQDPLDPWGRVLIEQGCASGHAEPCPWLADLAPEQGWTLAAMRDLGRGPLARRLRYVQVTPLPSAPSALQWWQGALPLLRPAGSADDPLPAVSRSDDGAVVARWSDAGFEVRDAQGRLKWAWTGGGVREVVVRPDGQQLLVRFATMFARVPLDRSTEPAQVVYDGYPETRELSLHGVLVRPDGWPAIGTRITSAGASWVVHTDLQGQFTVPSAGPSITVHLDGPSTTHLGPDGVDVTVRDGQQTPIPATR